MIEKELAHDGRLLFFEFLLKKLGVTEKIDYLACTKQFDYEIFLFAFGGIARVRECRRTGIEKGGTGVLRFSSAVEVEGI